MPHLFVNRPRVYDLIRQDKDLKKQFRWETINAVFYKLGGLIFVIGSILFYPSLSAYQNLGAWLFVAGSALYLTVTSHDLVECIRYRRITTEKLTVWDRLELGAALAYTAGTILFVAGSILFLSYVDRAHLGAWCFVLGSLLFVVGATVNVLQIVQAENMVTLQLMNLTAITFVTGSVLFTVASVPYLWSLADPADETRLDAYLASQYVAGSLLFLLGGVFNYWRAFVFIRGKVKRAEPVRMSPG
ncbi:YrhK family protein [Roseibium aggregatum]|uniref:YrhK family protein n=1 Tax=Roseibium aggregatum TaxID=187304 RepID=A0A939EDY7_9HYPH|nr:YrhK family protein [Roseibium aggregatum]MBN9671506.1 YrhK family protein [Roseibium aggregatum]